MDETTCQHPRQWSRPAIAVGERAYVPIPAVRHSGWVYVKLLTGDPMKQDAPKFYEIGFRKARPDERRKGSIFTLKGMGTPTGQVIDGEEIHHRTSAAVRECGLCGEISVDYRGPFASFETSDPARAWGLHRKLMGVGLAHRRPGSRWIDETFDVSAGSSQIARDAAEARVEKAAAEVEKARTEESTRLSARERGWASRKINRHVREVVEAEIRAKRYT